MIFLKCGQELIVFLRKCKEELFISGFLSQCIGAVREYTVFIVNGESLCK